MQESRSTDFGQDFGTSLTPSLLCTAAAAALFLRVSGCNLYLLELCVLAWLALLVWRRRLTDVRTFSTDLKQYNELVLLANGPLRHLFK